MNIERITSVPENAEYFVVGDIHGHYESLRELLLAAELIYRDDSLTELGKLIDKLQIGDLANAVYEDIDGDLKCLQTVFEYDWFDFILIGNHEAPLFMESPPFGGYYKDDAVATAYRRLGHHGKLLPSFVVGDTLISHAGVAKKFSYANVDEAHEVIQKEFEMVTIERGHSLLLNGIGRSRGGRDTSGGILWCDWMEAKSPNYNQIVGHTPQAKIQKRNYPSTGNWSVCVDVGAKSGNKPIGLWLDSDGIPLGYTQA